MIRMTLTDGREYQLSFNHQYQEIWVGDNGDLPVYHSIPVWGTARLFPVDEPEWAIEGDYTVHIQDNPDKAVGRRIALQRLTDKLDNKEDKRIVWESYRRSGAAIR